jgi:hypothetical protein
MEAEKESVIYMGLIPGPNKTDEICGKTMVTGTMHRGSTAFPSISVLEPADQISSNSV